MNGHAVTGNEVPIRYEARGERLQAALDELAQHRELLDLLYKASRCLDSWEEFSWLSGVMEAATRPETRIADLVAVLRNAILRCRNGFAPLGGE